MIKSREVAFGNLKSSPHKLATSTSVVRLKMIEILLCSIRGGEFHVSVKNSSRQYGSNPCNIPKNTLCEAFASWSVVEVLETA